MDRTKVKSRNNQDGITLVALVVTIIVLLILAGITLTLVLGQNGLIGKAQQAKDLSTNADKATEEGLNNLENELELSTSGTATKISDVSTIKDAISKTAIATTDNIALKDDNGNTVTIPAGFKIATDSATKQEDGIVIQDKDGNQFVWIPVTSISNYVRTDYGSSFDYGGYSSYSQTMPSDEQTSVDTYHGYYMGRYEAGDSISTASKILRASGTSTTNTVSIRKGQATYCNVTIDQANALATGMKTAEGYKATTKLCSSYAWDTALNYIQNKIGNYGISSSQGNYYNTTFNYTDITGANQTKTLNSQVLIPTGETTPTCNIYDMGGNDWEFTTETNSNSSSPYTIRGGLYNSNYTSSPAGSRYNVSSSDSNVNITFRITLYI